MKKERISRIIGGIDERFISEAAAPEGVRDEKMRSFEQTPQSRKPVRFKWAAAAAVIALFVLIGTASTAFAVEAKEYNKAVTFFEENGLSAKGLSRSEVKAVYRDIITKSFSYEKTAEVLRQTVPGREILQQEPRAGELEELWNQNVRRNSVSEKGVGFRISAQYVKDPQSGLDVLDKCVLECYLDGNLTWSAEFKEFYIMDYAHTAEGTVVWGQSDVFSTSDTVHAWIALVDNAGNTVWQKRLDHGFKHEYVASVINNGDGTRAVISRGDFRYLCLGCYDANGEELSFRKTEVGNFGIRNAARLGDGYLIQLWNSAEGGTALLCKMDREGVLTDKFSYEEDHVDYYITDMVEFAGQVYLSAYAVPKQKDEGGRHEIADILDYVFSNTDGGIMISSEELTPLVRENYTAMLLVCDQEGGAPKTFYSVKGSLGGKLATDGADQLEWNVESIVSTFISPYTNSFTVGGTCRVFRYSFDASGELIGQTDTETTVPYRR